MIKTKWIEIDWWDYEQTLQIREKITKYKIIFEINEYFSEYQDCAISFSNKKFPNFSFDFLFLHISGTDLEEYGGYVILDRTRYPITEEQIMYREHWRWVRQAYREETLPKTSTSRHIFFDYYSWRSIFGFRFKID